jgi:hypothetical protein
MTRLSQEANLLAAAALLLAAGGCAGFAYTSPPFSSASAAVDRRVLAEETVNQWYELPARAARRLMVDYGVPDTVTADSLSWKEAGPWRRIVVRNLRPSAVEGVDIGIVEQSIVYPMTPKQSALLADFDDRLAYDPESRELAARSDRETYNFLRLNLADDVARGRLTPEQARASYARTVELEASGKSSPDMAVLRLAP